MMTIPFGTPDPFDHGPVVNSWTVSFARPRLRSPRWIAPSGLSLSEVRTADSVGFDTVEDDLFRPRPTPGRSWCSVPRKPSARVGVKQESRARPALGSVRRIGLIFAQLRYTPGMNRLLAGLLVVVSIWSFGCAAAPVSDREQAATVTADAYLRHLVGEWDIRRSIRGTVVGNRMTVEPVLGGSFVRLHMLSTSASDPYEAIVLVGYDARQDDYVAYWCDSFGPGLSAVGRGKRKENRLELRFDYPSGPFFNTWRFDPASDSWTFTGENGGADGTRTPFASDVVTRR